MYHPIHFSVIEVQELLKKLLPDIKEMINLTKALKEQEYDIYKHSFFSGIGSNGTGKYPDEINRLIDIVKKISVKGVIIKEIESALLDFPHIRENGDEVYLCWKYGEETILYWHGIRDGFSGRKSIDEL